MSLDLLPHTFMGVADPVGRGLGFLLPVFRRHGANHWSVERVGVDGRVAGFTDLDPPDLGVKDMEPQAAAVGDPPLWAFAFGPDDVVLGRGREAREQLTRRLADPLFKARPMLGVELAEFVENPGARAAMALAAFDRLHKASPQSAARWRDLCLLTPDLRRALERTRSEGPAHDAPPDSRRVVAKFDRGVVTVRLGQREAAAWSREAISMAIHKAIGPLMDLYDRGTPRLEIEIELFVADREDERKRTAIPVWLAEAQLETLASLLERDAGLKVFRSVDRQEYRRARDAGRNLGVVVFLSEDNEGQGGGRLLDAPANEVGFQVRRPSLRRREPDILARDLYPATIVDLIPSNGFGSGVSTTSLVRLVREAARFVQGGRFDLQDDSLRSSTLLRARGFGPDAQADALALLYSQAWRLGLRTDVGVQAVSPRFSDGSGWGKVLFPRLQQAIAPSPAPGDGDSADVTVLVPSEPIPPYAGAAEYRRVVQHVLRRQGWRPTPSADGDDDVFTIQGGRGHWRCGYDFRGGPNKVPRWTALKLREMDVTELEVLIVGENAGAGQMIARLCAEDALTANLRDLMTFNAIEGSVWSLFAAQLKRLATSMASRSRTHYFALWLRGVIQHGRIKVDHGETLRDVFNAPDLGEYIHIVCTSVTTSSEAVTGLFRVVATENNRFLATGRDVVAPFALTIGQGRPLMTVPNRS